MKDLSANYWNDRYVEDNTPWNIGHISPPIKKYIDTLDDKTCRILIPGAGHAHEAVYLHTLGFSNVFICDWAANSFENVKRNCPDFPKEHLIISDFFTLGLTVDLILEQTFFCAINPSFRTDYARKVNDILSSKGRLAGLLFAQPFEREGPPFGGTKEEYTHHFSPYFTIEKMEDCSDSIKPRLGGELFVELVKNS